VDSSYPIYVLRLGKKDKIVYPEGMVAIGHCDFWEQTVSFAVAEFYRLAQKQLIDLPYSQRRARICGNIVYYGEQPRPALLEKIKKAVGNKKLAFAYDEHETHLGMDVLQFKRLLARQKNDDRK
jgi:hypothetical protein